MSTPVDVLLAPFEPLFNQKLWAGIISQVKAYYQEIAYF